MSPDPVPAPHLAPSVRRYRQLCIALFIRIGETGYLHADLHRKVLRVGADADIAHGIQRRVLIDVFDQDHLFFVGIDMIHESDAPLL